MLTGRDSEMLLWWL